MSPLRIIFAGSGEFGLPTLRRVIDSRDAYEIVQVVTQPDRPSGRGRKLSPTAIARLALQHDLPLIRTANVNEERLPDGDAMVVIAFGQKVAPRTVDHPRLGSINLHASILPKYRGAAPINWAIIEGENVTGNSVIRLAARMDAGAVLAQSQIEIGELETAGEVHDRLAADGAVLIPRVLDELASGTATESPQDDAHATPAPKLTRAHAVIDWTRDARAIANQVRGTYPWPGCHVRLMDGADPVARVTLVRAQPMSGPTASPATVLESGYVSTGDGVVQIVELQPEGKRPMTLDAYRHGHRWSAGMRLESITS